MKTWHGYEIEEESGYATHNGLPGINCCYRQTIMMFDNYGGPVLLATRNGRWRIGTLRCLIWAVVYKTAAKEMGNLES